MIRTSIILRPELHELVKAEADKLDRSMNYTISLLLHQAVKERNRKKKDGKNSQIPNHPTDTRS